MNRSTFYLPQAYSDRLSVYMGSPQYRNLSVSAKSDYWKYHADQINVEIRGRQVSVEGVSGHYIPPRRSTGVVLSGLARSSTRRLRGAARQLLGTPEIKMLDYRDAFDRLMRHDPVAQVELSHQRVNYKELAKKPGVFPSTAAIRRDLFLLDRYVLETHLMLACYYYNLLVGHTGNGAGRAILEIGAGSGLLSAIMFRYVRPRLVIVDLPEVIPLSFLFLADLFQDAKFRLPNEVNSPLNPDDDIVFLTPAQVDYLPDDSIDLAINVESFQEMTHAQIREYFRLIRRVSSHGASVFTSNRVEKIPLDPEAWNEATTAPVNRFSDYPWDPANEVVIWEICKLHRLTKLDDMYIRLERIRK
jgi:putative sugar O-methyltransferase